MQQNYDEKRTFLKWFKIFMILSFWLSEKLREG